MRSSTFPPSKSAAANLNLARCWFAAILIVLSAGAPRAWAASTTTTLAVTSAGSAVTTVASGGVVTLTATVKAGSTAVTQGQVNFCDATAAHCTDIHLLGTAQLTSAGTAVMKFRPGIGDQSYKAIFLGTKTDASSFSSNSALTVTATGKYSTTTTIAQSSTAFDNYSLTATVTGIVNSTLLDSPTGMVSFLDTSNGNASLGSGALSGDTFGLSWVNSASLSAGTAPSFVVVADFNGDGIPDVALANSEYEGIDDQVTLYLGNGDGTFHAVASPTLIEVGYPAAIMTADFNGDGIPDLAVANSDGSGGPTTLNVYLGNGDGTFQTPPEVTVVTTSTNPSALALADFNGDGIPDLALTDSMKNYVTILLGKGDGTFSAVAAAPATFPTGSTPFSIAVGDFNGDGIPDLAAVDQDDRSVTILLGNGDGTFTAAASPLLPYAARSSQYGYPVDALAVGDFNGDGKADIAVAMLTSTAEGSLAILLGNGNGTFTVTSPTLPISGITTSVSIAVGDFNGDGKADLAAASIGHCYEGETGMICANSAVDVFLGGGDGTFTQATESPTAVSPGTLAIGDFNGDGVPDLAVTDLYGASATVLLAQPTLSATSTVSNISLPVNSGTHQAEASYPGDSNYTSSVSGTTGLATGQLTFSASNVAFGNEDAGDTTDAFAIYLTNSSSSTQTISSIRLGGANPAAFATSNTCGASLTMGAECRIGVRFVPQAATAAAATITVTDSATDSPQTITLSGTGVNAPEATMAFGPNSVAFGNETVGFSTGAQPIYVTNTSSVTLYFHSITLGGTNASSFDTSNTCNGPAGGTVGGTLAPGAQCRIGVRFAPTTTGPLSATITLIDNTATSPQAITLSGTGQ